MTYVFLVYQDEDQWANVPDSERKRIEAACTAYEQELWQSGYLIANEDFTGNQTAVTVQVVNGKVSLVDSTKTENTRHLIQLFLINARDLNEAIQIIAKMPQTRKGPIEVHSLLKPDGQQFLV